MNITPRGKRFIQNAEGLRLKAYHDITGKLTIGYGHLVTPIELHLYTQLKTTITGEEATAIFEKDLESKVAALNAALSECKGMKPNQNQFDALCAFIFNIGVGAWIGSTARRDLVWSKIDMLPGEMDRWVHDEHGNVIPGLVNRRHNEVALFKTPLKV